MEGRGGRRKGEWEWGIPNASSPHTPLELGAGKTFQLSACKVALSAKRKTLFRRGVGRRYICMGEQGGGISPLKNTVGRGRRQIQYVGLCVSTHSTALLRTLEINEEIAPRNMDWRFPDELR